MARNVTHAKIENPTTRAKLRRGRQPHLQSLIEEKAALAYQRKEGPSAGRWLLRRTLTGDKIVIVPLGLADDQKGVAADGVAVLTFEQAKAKALETVAQSHDGLPKGPLTVRTGFAKYID